MIDRPSNAFQFIDDVELEDQIFKRVYNRDEKSIDEYIVGDIVDSTIYESA